MNKNAYNVWVVKLRKRLLVRPSHRKENNVKMHLREYDERDSSDSGQGPVYVVTNFQFP
jgi:hypothetical protein